MKIYFIRNAFYLGLKSVNSSYRLVTIDTPKKIDFSIHDYEKF